MFLSLTVLMNTGALTIGLTSNTAKAYKEGKGQLIIQTDAKLSKEQLNKYRDFVKKTGKNVVIEDIAHTEVTNDDGSVTNYRTLGETDSDDTIRVNMKELDSLVEEHELSHTLENTPGFKDFKKIVLDTIYQTDDAKRNDDINKVKEKYGENADSREKAENEIVAEFVRNEDLLSQIPDNKRGSIKRMLTSLKAKASRLSQSKNSTDAETLKATNELISQFEKVLNKSKKMSLTEAIARGNTSLYSPYIDENGKVRFNNGEIGKEKGESKYLIYPEFEKQFDRWVERGKDNDILIQRKLVI